MADHRAEHAPRPLSGGHGHAASDTLGPYALLVLAMLLWSGNWIIGRALHDAVAPSALTFWRWFITALLLLPFAWRGVVRHWEDLRRNWAVVLGLSVTGAALSHWLLYGGLRHTTAINALLIFSTQPAWIIALSRLLGQETVTPRQLAGVALSFLGSVVIVCRGDPAVLLDLSINIGDLIILAAMPPMALYPILLRRYPLNIGVLGTLFASASVAALLIAPVFAYDTLYGIPTFYTPSSVGGILYIAVFASALAFYLYSRGVAAVGANRSGFLSHLLPAFGTAMAVVFLGETFRGFHVVGIGLIVAGLYLSTVSRRGGAPMGTA